MKKPPVAPPSCVKDREGPGDGAGGTGFQPHIALIGAALPPAAPGATLAARNGRRNVNHVHVGRCNPEADLRRGVEAIWAHPLDWDR